MQAQVVGVNGGVTGEMFIAIVSAPSGLRPEVKQLQKSLCESVGDGCSP